MKRYLTGPLLLTVALAWLVAGIVWPPTQIGGWGAVPAGLLGGAGVSLIIIRWPTRP